MPLAEEGMVDMFGLSGVDVQTSLHCPMLTPVLSDMSADVSLSTPGQDSLPAV